MNDPLQNIAVGEERDAVAWRDAEIVRLLTENEALLADAELYRYLRRHARRIDVAGLSITDMTQLSERIAALAARGEGLVAPCARCGQPITAAEFPTAVMVDHFSPERNMRVATGPLHEECATAFNAALAAKERP